MLFREPLLLLVGLLISLSHSFRTRIIKTAIVDFLPDYKQHHIVVIEKHNRILYIVDFSPINQSNWRTLFRLALAQDVPAEIRVKPIVGVDFYNDDLIIDQWLNKKCITNVARVFPVLDHWNSETMNLYTHNCQHFSSFMVGHYC